MAIWKLSPVVGEIRDRKASVIFELYNKTDIVEYSINNTNKTKVGVELNGPTKVVLNFEKEGNHLIRWFVNNVFCRMHNIVVSDNINKLIFVSCDLLEADTENSLWVDMENELSLIKKVGIAHLGDQAYMDPVFNYCKKVIDNNNDISDKNVKLNDNELTNVCFEAYGKRYCDTWMPHQTVLANVSNYYIWDDHEITNDVVLDSIVDDSTLIISRAAVKAYKEYQQSFHLEDNTVINDYCWYKHIDSNKSTVMLAIERTSREITIDEIFAAIEKINNENKITRLILCFSSAPLPIPDNNYYGKSYIKLKGTGKFWSAGKLELLYRSLFDWIDTDKQINREVVVVGGDVHFGVHGSVKKNDKIIPVIIASPITNQPYPDRSLASKGLKGEHWIDDNGEMIFTTLSTKARRCYGTLDLDTVPMTSNIVYCRDKYPNDIYKYLKAMSKF